MPHCFFVEPTESTVVLLPEDKTHHVVHVLKMQAGERIVVHDGQNRRAEAVLELVGKKRISARLVSPWSALDTEAERPITIFQAMPRTGDKVEQVLQHGTELGATGFVLFASERAQARFEERERIEKKLERWSELIRNAAEQSRRGVLPQITYRRNLEEALSLMPESSLLLDEDGAALSVEGTAPLGVFVGPESGFTEAEKQAIRARGARSVSLGPRTLRTETAALAVLAKLL